MTGPPYPPLPLPGSNAIGSFVIGVSPIGTIKPFDPLRTVISQYANSPILMQLIDNFDQYVDQTANMDAFFDNIWNMDTATGYGLDVWGRIVGVSRILQITGGDVFLGFAQAAGANINAFGQAPFYKGAPLTDNFRLTDSAFRSLIFTKAFANICDGSIPAINQILLNLFPNRGNCYVTDEGDMEITYTFEFILSPLEQAIIADSGVLPKPVGVSATIVQA